MKQKEQFKKFIDFLQEDELITSKEVLIKNKEIYSSRSTLINYSIAPNQSKFLNVISHIFNQSYINNKDNVKEYTLYIPLRFMKHSKKIKYALQEAINKELIVNIKPGVYL